MVGEGVLTKICRKRAKPRQFFLFNDALVYGNIIIHKKKVNDFYIVCVVISIIELNNSTVMLPKERAYSERYIRDRDK